MDSPWVKRGLLVATGLVLAIVALLLLWPRGTPTARERIRALPSPPVTAAAATQPAPAPVVAHEPEPPEDDLADAPPNCRTIVQWHRRNVPAWVIEDNMDAQAMLFDEAELGCLTAAGIPPQILDRAEQHVRKPQPPVPR